MATKTIMLHSVTIHVKDDEKSIPVKYDQNYAVVEGRTVVKEIPPKTPVTLPADEADRLLARFDGEEVKPSKKAAAAE